MRSLGFKLFSIILIICLGIIIYSNSFRCSFHFDDKMFTTDNLTIRDINDPLSIWQFFPCRFITFYSFAVNYYFNKFDVFGYHLFNLLVHIFSALLVWWLALLTLSTPLMRLTTTENNGVAKKLSQKSGKGLPAEKLALESKVIGHADIMALLAGLIFVSHPVQTEAVTFIWQRNASMAAMFCLASLCLYVRSRLSDGQRSGFVYYILALITAILAMLTKETSVCLPLLILLYEFVFLKSKKGMNWVFLSPLLLTIFIIPLINIFFTNAQNVSFIQGTVEVSGGISPWQYFLTEFKVMLTYLRLFLWPFNLNLDYDYPISRSIFEIPTLLSILSVSAILYSLRYLFPKYKLIFFSILWFALTCAPEAAPYPVKDVIFEHRLYLPLVGYCIILVSGLYYLPPKRFFYPMIVLIALIIGINSYLTYQRNSVWKSEFSLWDDTVRKSPHKARPLNNLGKVFLDEGQYALALIYLNKAIEADANYELTYINRGTIFYKQGHFDQALDDFNKAIDLNPHLADAYKNRGLSFYALGKWPQALDDFNKAIEMDPHDAKALNTRGIIYDKLGNMPQAMSDMNKAIEIDPRYAEAYANRGNAYAEQGNMVQAMSDLNKAVELDPYYADAYYNRGSIYNKQGNLSEALSDFNKTIAIDPKYSQAYNNRGIIDAEQNNLNQAIADFTKAIETDGKNEEAYTNRGLIYEKQNNLKQALFDYNKAIEIDAKYTDAYFKRGNIHAKQNEPALALADFSQAIEINPRYGLAYNNRAIVYYQSKDYSNAWRDVHKAQELGVPVNPDLINALKAVSPT